MHVFGLEMKSIGQILLVGLALGAGLPLIFALGIRASAWGTGGPAEITASDGTADGPHPGGKVLGAVCFGVVVVAVILGLAFIVATGLGKNLSFGLGTSSMGNLGVGLFLVTALVLLIAVLCGVAAGHIAWSNGASFNLYFWLGIVFGVVGILAAALARPSRTSTTAVNNYRAGDPDAQARNDRPRSRE